MNICGFCAVRTLLCQGTEKAPPGSRTALCKDRRKGDYTLAAARVSSTEAAPPALSPHRARTAILSMSSVRLTLWTPLLMVHTPLEKDSL